MRPFVCSLLKCAKCESVKPQKLAPVDITKVAPPSCVPRIADFRKEEDFLKDLVDTLSKINSEIIDIDEADIYAFLESNDNEMAAVSKIVEALYGVEVITGSVTCIDCGEMKSIRNGILYYEES